MTVQKRMDAYFLPYAVFCGRENMEIDEKLLDYAIENQLKAPVFRLYGWEPACVSLGRNQKDTGVDKDFCQNNGIDIVRRLTGGRALLHDKELTYSFVCPCGFLKNGETVIQSYKEISGALALGLSKIGIMAEFPENKKAHTNFEYCMSLSTGADLCFEGKKIVGSAQFRKQGYILQHGSIMFDCDAEMIQKVFHESLQNDKIATLKESVPAVNLAQLSNALVDGMEEYFGINLLLKEGLSAESLLRRDKRA